MGGGARAARDNHQRMGVRLAKKTDREETGGRIKSVHNKGRRNNAQQTRE